MSLLHLCPLEQREQYLTVSSQVILSADKEPQNLLESSTTIILLRLVSSDKVYQLEYYLDT